MPSPAQEATDLPPPQAAGAAGALTALPAEWRAAIEDFIMVRVAEEMAKRDGNASATLSIREAIPLMPPGKRSASSVRRWIKRGALPARKVDSRWVLNRDDVLAAGQKAREPRVRVEQILNAFARRKREKYPRRMAGISQKIRGNL